MYLSLLLQELLPGLAGLDKLSLVGAMAIAIWWLARKLDSKEKQLDRSIEVNHEQAKATEDVADALERLVERTDRPK